MKVFVEETDISPEKAFSALHPLPYSLWLDSADTAHPNGRYSYICARPVETIEAKERRVTITNAGQQTILTANPFDVIKERVAAWNPGNKIVEGLPPFQGGLAGMFGYDLARAIENLPDTARAAAHMPDMAVGIYDQVMAFDHESGKGWFITHAKDEREAKLKRATWQNVIRHKQNERVENAAVKWNAPDDAESYRAKIKSVIEYIHAGDIFQANLSQRFEAVLPPGFDQFSQYMEMREVNPAPFAAYMNLGGIVIASASPEQFLQVQDKIVTTRPIKGTAARGMDREEDERNKATLTASDKDRAENIMIVDLLRNDLSKVCDPHSVEVTELCKLETFANVHHLVSTIKGKLRETSVDLLRACFPGGSITGAPKIRAMQIIEELEATRRGPYCGSLAWMGFDGAMDSNILIRTLVYQGNKVTLQAGGGITAESWPADEYDETLAKAEKILQTVEDEPTVRKRA